MQAYNRISSIGHNTPSPPPSPRYRHGKGMGKGGRFPSDQQPRTLGHRLTRVLFHVLLRRRCIFLFAPLICIVGMLFYVGTVSLDVVPHIMRRPPPGSVPPGSVYRSPQLYVKLRPEIDSDNSSSRTDALATVWKHPYKGGDWRPCINKSIGGLPDSNGYIYVEANGGLNQQRSSVVLIPCHISFMICNAVAVAGYLNATLVIPHLTVHSIWRDPSKFSDIYDEDHFISTLKNDVRVVDKIPEYIMEQFDHNMSNVHNFKVQAWARIQQYRNKALPELLKAQIIRISPFAKRLSNDAPPAVQYLRCLANFEALQFSNPITILANNLIARMKEHSANNNGKYVAVHLRFEEDIVAFSCCVFDGGEEEKKEMNAIRERGWKGKFTKPGRVIRPGAIRIDGKCPLTPLEVGLMLRGMGFDNSTSVYMASGKIYNSEKTMAPLLEMFPFLQNKDTLASVEELAPFKNYSSRMAAIDYTVCLHSEVFVTTHGGNFQHFLLGHRRYLYGGHSKTIKPDKKQLALLFDDLNIGVFNMHQYALVIPFTGCSNGVTDELLEYFGIRVSAVGGLQTPNAEHAITQ